MRILLLLVPIFLFGVGCVSVGKVGYIVPAENDSGEYKEEKLGEKCESILVDILDHMNKDMEGKGNSDNEDIALVMYNNPFLFKNCVHSHKLK